MGTQTWIYSIIIYFTLIAAFLAVITPVLDSSVTVDTSQMGLTKYAANDSVDLVQPESTSAWSVGKYLNVLFSFFVWDNDGVLDFNQSGIIQLIIKMFFVYLPLIMLFMGIYYSLPTVSG